VSHSGRGDRSRGGNRGRGRGRGGPPPRTNDNHGCGSNARPPCQICGKVGHTAIRCWHRNDDSYNTDSPSTAVAHTSSYTIDPNWYVDTGATDHITSDLDRLALRERYHGGEQVQVGNGAGLQILHTGHSTINSDHRPLALRNILHVPDISKIFFPSKNFHVKTMCFLNSIRPIFQLRIVGQGEDSWKGGVKAGSTQSHFLINRSSSMHS
jgi:hypothetical protein